MKPRDQGRGGARSGDDAPPRRFVFVLLPQFSLHGFASAVDCLRIANRAAGRRLYEWRLWAEGGRTVASSAGVALAPESGLAPLEPGDTAILCGGIDIRAATTPALLAWLRREARRGATMGGLCTAAYALARAGLLDGRRATIHWENQDSFAEEFGEVLLTKSLFAIDGGRLTTAAGTASVDLMLRIVADEHGEALAGLVADQLLHGAGRADGEAPRLSVPARIGLRHPRLAQVVEAMEASIEDPVSPSALAREAGLSARQLERLFRRHLDRSPKRFYMELRLQKARNLLAQTDMSVINVALACGFASPSHFSKCYRALYATTPHRERGGRAARLSV